MNASEFAAHREALISAIRDRPHATFCLQVLKEQLAIDFPVGPVGAAEQLLFAGDLLTIVQIERDLAENRWGSTEDGGDGSNE